MASPYKRRKRSLVRNLWVYRRLVGLAIVVGLLLWFVLTNNAQVKISFPFGVGPYESTTGLVILLSALVGSILTAVGMTLFLAIRKARLDRDEAPEKPSRSPMGDDLPPSDYAAKTGDGLTREGPWS